MSEAEERERLRYLQLKAKRGAAPSAPAVSEIEAGWEGAKQGLTFGLGDEINGGIQALGAKLQGDPGSLGDLYKLNRDTFRRENKAAQEAHPNYHAAGELTGGLATAALPGGAVGKGFGKAVGAAAAQGALTGFGASEADNLEELAGDTAIGAGLGGLGGVAGVGIGKAAGAAGKGLKGIAERRALKAAGAIQSDVKRLSQNGKLQEAGRFILDEKLLGPFGWGGVERVSEKAGKRASKAGAEMGGTLKQLDEIVPDAIVPSNVADEVQEQLITPLRQRLGTEGTEARMSKLAEKIRAMEPGLARGEIGPATKRGFSFSEAEDQLKRSLDEGINWNAARPDKAEPAKQVRRQISSYIEDRAGEVSPELAEQFSKQKRDFGLAREVEKLADGAADRELGNRVVSPSDYGAGIAGGAALGPAGGLGTAAANHVGRKYGSATAAQVSDLIGAALASGNTEEAARLLTLSAGRFSKLRDAVRK